jgi:hypothetical protein
MHDLRRHSATDQHGFTRIRQGRLTSIAPAVLESTRASRVGDSESFRESRTSSSQEPQKSCSGEGGETDTPGRVCSPPRKRKRREDFSPRRCFLWGQSCLWRYLNLKFATYVCPSAKVTCSCLQVPAQDFSVCQLKMNCVPSHRNTVPPGGTNSSMASIGSWLSQPI